MLRFHLEQVALDRRLLAQRDTVAHRHAALFEVAGGEFQRRAGDAERRGRDGRTGGIKGLLAVDDPLLAVFRKARASADRGGIRAGVWLGHRHRSPFGLAFLEALQEALFLLGRASGLDRRAAECAAWR